MRNRRPQLARSVTFDDVLLSDVLNLPMLQDAGLRIVAGENNIERQIGWVHSGEIPDIARFLSGGEVLLTAATGLSSNGADPKRYVAELAAAGAAGVIIELGRTFKELPAEMVQEAERLGLVVAVLDTEVPFVAVTRSVHTAILNEQHEAQERATRIGDEFSQLLLDGAQIPEMLDLLAERLQNPVVLEDGSRHVVAFGHGRGSVAPLLREWQ